MTNDCVDVDELIPENRRLQSDYAEMAAEKLFRKCSTSWGNRTNTCGTSFTWLVTQQRTSAVAIRIIKRIQVQITSKSGIQWAYPVFINVSNSANTRRLENRHTP